MKQKKESMLEIKEKALINKVRDIFDDSSVSHIEKGLFVMMNNLFEYENFYTSDNEALNDYYYERIKAAWNSKQHIIGKWCFTKSKVIEVIKMFADIYLVRIQMDLVKRGYPEEIFTGPNADKIMYSNGANLAK